MIRQENNFYRELTDTLAIYRLQLAILAPKYMQDLYNCPEFPSREYPFFCLNFYVWSTANSCLLRLLKNS